MLSRIYRHLKTSGESRRAFGVAVLNDPGFVRDLENGRIPSVRTERRVVTWLDLREGAAR